jgi:hypothetical protein
MDTYTKWMTALVTATLLAFTAEKITSQRQACEIYQGASPDAVNGNMSYVFDPNPEGREGDARFSIIGDPELKNSLIREQRYCFTYAQPLASWKPSKDLKIEQRTSSDLEAIAQ